VARSSSILLLRQRLQVRLDHINAALRQDRVVPSEPTRCSLLALHDRTEEEIHRLEDAWRATSPWGLN